MVPHHRTRSALKPVVPMRLLLLNTQDAPATPGPPVYLLAFRVEILSFDVRFVVRQMILWYRVITGKGQRTRELTTTCNSRHRRAGDGYRSETHPNHKIS